MTETGPFKINSIRDPDKNKKQQPKRVKTWSFGEMVRYTVYLQTILESNLQKINKKWNKQDYQEMARMIRSRNSNQCRIFHNKMTRVYHTIADIFAFFKCNIKNYNSIYEKYQQQKKIGQKTKTDQTDHQLQQIEEQNRNENRQEQVDYFEGFLQKMEQDFPPIKTQNREVVQQQRPHDWFQEFDDYMNQLHGSWLDDI